MPLSAEEEKMLAEVLAEVPPYEPTQEDLSRMAAIWEEGFSEGHQKRPRVNPHGD